MSTLYTSIITAKNGLAVPLFASNKPVHSKYDPTREANTFVQTVTNIPSFCIVIGIGGGYHLSALLEHFTDCEFLAVEYSDEDLLFLQQIPTVTQLKQHKNIHFCTMQTLSVLLKQLYVPARYGDLQILTLPSWIHENPEPAEHIKNIITQTIKDISADYSVQSHFGNIWQRNIMANLTLCTTERITPPNLPEALLHKTAVVIAAGPTLDTQITRLKQHRESYYILATDTTYNVLLQQHIIPDVVVSIDGQMISHTHYMGSLDRHTLFVFDICANTAAVHHVAKNEAKILFVTTGHPLALYAEEATYCRFIHITAGSGTVTIAAADFARYIGFTDIQFIGADFSYPNGKPYCRGTYLDTLYNQNTSKVHTSEQQFAQLMFRTPLIDAHTIPGAKTTEVLDSYRKTLEAWIQDSQKSQVRSQMNTKTMQEFTWNTFITQFKHDAQTNTLNAGLLPYIAYLRYMNAKNGKELNFFEMLKLAYSNAMRYTKLL